MFLETANQIADYKSAIAAQFNKSLYEASGGVITGSISFFEGNSSIKQSLSLGKLNEGIAGVTTELASSVNLFHSNGDRKSNKNVGIDALHEILHTLRLDHPFETTQSEDTKLFKTGTNMFSSGANTDPNIVNNVMNYSSTTIDGKNGLNQSYLTKGQLRFMLGEIQLQNSGYGFEPKYNPNLSNEQNTSLWNLYYRSYWDNIPGTPVEEK